MLRAYISLALLVAPCSDEIEVFDKNGVRLVENAVAALRPLCVK